MKGQRNFHSQHTQKKLPFNRNIILMYTKKTQKFYRTQNHLTNVVFKYLCKKLIVPILNSFHNQKKNHLSLKRKGKTTNHDTHNELLFYIQKANRTKRKTKKNIYEKPMTAQAARPPAFPVFNESGWPPLPKSSTS